MIRIRRPHQKRSSFAFWVNCSVVFIFDFHQFAIRQLTEKRRKGFWTIAF